MRVLPENLRDALKEPIGLLTDGENLLKILKEEKYVVSVGDMVTFTLLSHDIEPVFCVVDYKTRRGEFPEESIELIKSFGKKSVVVENPHGCISDDLWNVIKYAYKNLKKGSLRIEIEGEEDLAALPVIFFAFRDVTIIYGLPNKGVVIVKANKENKSKVKDILDKM